MLEVAYVYLNCTALYHTILHYAILDYYNIIYYTILYCTMIYYTVLYHTTLSSFLSSSYSVLLLFIIFYWNRMEKRRLFNYRLIVFSPSGLPADLKEKMKCPLLLVERCTISLLVFFIKCCSVNSKLWKLYFFPFILFFSHKQTFFLLFKGFRVRSILDFFLIFILILTLILFLFILLFLFLFRFTWLYTISLFPVSILQKALKLSVVINEQILGEKYDMLKLKISFDKFKRAIGG